MKRSLATALCFLLLAGTALAHGGEDHAHEAEPAPAAGQMPQVEITGADLELVGVVADRSLTIYLDRKATNEPVDGADIKVFADGIPAGTAKQESPGTYKLPAPWADDPGTKPLKFLIEAGGGKAELAGDLTILAEPHSETAGAMGWGALLASPLTWALAAIAAAFGFVLAFAFRPARVVDGMTAASSIQRPTTLPALIPLAIVLAGTLAVDPSPAAAHGGEDHADEQPAAAHGTSNVPRRLPDGVVYLPKVSQRLLHVRTLVAEPRSTRPSRELIATVVSDPSSFGQVQAPMDGRIELAERGISHIGQRVQAGEVLAYLSPSIPIADLGTMQQLRADVAGKLRIAEQKLSRLTRIASVIAQKEIDDTKTELEALKEQQKVLAEKDVELIPLKAPVTGIISVANVRAGQVVTTRETLFEIVDPHRLWIEAISGVEHAAPSIEGAYATDQDGHSIKLSYIGRAPALRQQTQPLQFRVDESHDGLVIGSAVKVFVQQGDPIEGIVVPDQAVVRGADGLARVWLKESPQTFRPQPVRIAPLDGNNVVIVGGVEPDSRVVVDGAELLNQVR